MAAELQIPACKDKITGFIIPHFNNANYFDDCLQSILKASGPFDQIIIVDDCSSDPHYASVASIVRAYKSKYEKNIQLLRCEVNSGPSAARNLGVRALESCDFIQFLDADDMLDPVGFKATKSAMIKNDDIDMAYGIQRAFGERDHYWMPTDSNMLACLTKIFPIARF